MDSWVKMPPRTKPRAAPVGAPAENVENAIDRMLDGGNACAKMPICVTRSNYLYIISQGKERTAEGMVAAVPIPWKPRRISIVTSSVKLMLDFL